MRYIARRAGGRLATVALASVVVFATVFAWAEPNSVEYLRAAGWIID
jgi:hypothetical protein